MKVSFVPPESYRRRFLYNFVESIVACWCHCFYQFEVYGKNHIPSQGPAVIAPKHQYWTDIPLVARAFYKLPLYYLAKNELFSLPLISSFLSALGGIPLNREAPIKTLDSFKHLNLLLKRSQKIVIFPEGTYYRSRVGKGKSRLIKMILKFQETEQLPEPIPFIPVGIIYQKKGFRERVKITIGEPLYADKESEGETLTKEIMHAIACLSDLDLNAEKQ
jgi:1-acyl-sn-glycerol-3-phosphate acyltransferase